MPSFRFIFRAFSICLLIFWGLFLQVGPVSALTVPALKGRVNDYAQILSPATISQLDNALRYFEQQESTQIVVLIVPTLEGDSLEDFSIRVAESWKIGRKKLDSGAILLIAKQEKKLRIEVGYGLEGKLTDLVSGRIIRDVIATQFKQGNFDQGVIDGVTAMMAAVKGEFNVKASPPPPRKNTHKKDPFSLIVPLIILFGVVGTLLHQKKAAAAAVGAVGSPLLGLFFLGSNWLALLALIAVGLLGGLAASTMQSGGRSGGGFFSGSGGFGGGSSGGDSGGFSGGGGDFGGGGASGDW